MLRHGILKLSLAMAALVAISVPVLAAGLPACCRPKTEPPACCAMKAAAAAMPKGCCKAPEAPKPESRVKQVAPAGVAASAPSVAAVVDSSEVPALVAAHAARREHRAPSPDDSPPDRLSRNHVLLI